MTIINYKKQYMQGIQQHIKKRVQQQQAQHRSTLHITLIEIIVPVTAIDSMQNISIRTN
jgi:hypothetical protein